ncbi:GNAT family N-acetyltransferase [Deinococcus altitudinis]|uniref:GNAT family N-acetyltransferase n=1 Tax=Deinococcus altitudinis TaxID=468914 RepID=UPI00389176B6
MNTGIQIRAANPKDAATIALHRYPGEKGEHLAVYAAWLPGVMSRGSYVGWLAKEGHRVIGGAGLLLLDWQPSRTEASPIRGRVVNVFVEPEFRRQGVARRLLLGVLDEARRLGVPGVGLSTSAEGRPLYASLGFGASVDEMYLEMKRQPGIGSGPSGN